MSDPVDGGHALWIAVAGAASALLATLSGIYTGRNARLSARDDTRLKQRQEDEKARLSTLIELNASVASLGRRVRELEDELRDQRGEWDKERRELIRERSRAWTAFDRVYDDARACRHHYANVHQAAVAELHAANVVVPPALLKAVLPLLERDAFAGDARPA